MPNPCSKMLMEHHGLNEKTLCRYLFNFPILMKSNSFKEVGFYNENHKLIVPPLFVIRAATISVHTCQDTIATFGLITAD